MTTLPCIADCIDDCTASNTDTFFFGDDQWWNSASNLHIDYQNDRIRNAGVDGVVSDINTNTSANLSSAGLHIPASGAPLVSFSDYSWLDSNDYTIVMRVRSTSTADNRRILGFASAGRGSQTDGPTEAKYHSGTTINVDNTIGSSNFNDANGALVAISGDQYGRSIVFGDRGLVNTSDLTQSMTALYVGSRENAGTAISTLDGYVLEFYHIPGRQLDNALRQLTNPSHDVLTTGDFVLDSSLGSVDGNKYDTIANLVAASRIANNTTIGFQAGSKFKSVSLDLSSYTNTSIIKHGSGADPELYGRGIVTNWTAATEANVYQTTVDTSNWGEPGVSQFITVFESLAAASDVALDDTPLTLQTSEANCSANPGSMYVDYSNPNLATVYQHTTNSDDPTTNGLAYSVSNSTNRRMFQDAQQIVGNMVVDNVVTDDGISTKTGGLIKNITVQHGHTHGLFCHENARIENVTVKNTLNTGQGVSPFVANGASQGGTFHYEGCTSNQESAFDRANCGGFYAHKSGSLRFTSGGSNNCTSIGCGSTGGNVGWNETTAGYCHNHTFRECRRGLVLYPSNNTLEFTKFWAEGKNVTNQGIERLVHSSGTLTSDQTFYIRGGAALSYGNSGGLIYITQPGTYNIQYNTFVGSSGLATPLAIRIANSEAIVVIENCILSGHDFGVYVDGDYGSNITFRNNVIHNLTNGFHYNGSTRTLSQFESDIATASNNIEADPTFTFTPANWDTLSDCATESTAVSDRSAGAEYYGDLFIKSQTANYGALSLAGDGAIAVDVINGSVTTATIDSGDTNSHFSISVESGIPKIAITSAGDTANLSGSPYTLKCSFSDGTNSVKADVIVTAVADSYTYATDADLTALLGVADATMSGKTWLGRPGNYGILDIEDKAYTSEVKVAAHDTSNRPIFEQIIVDNSDNITLENVEIVNESTSGSGLSIVGPVDTIKFDQGSIRGIVYDHATDYTSSAYPGNINGVNSNASAGAVQNVTISNSLITEVEEGIVLGDVDGNVEVIGNEISYMYEDAVKIGRVDNFGTHTKVNDNYFHGCLSLASDSGNPHTDAIQFLGSNLTASWTGIEVLRNVCICEERGTAQLIFADDAGAGIYFDGMVVKGNLMLTKTSAQGCWVNRAKDVEVIGNTFAKMNPDDGVGSATTINIGSDQTSGTHKIWQNITEGQSVGGTPDSQNNIILGLNGATIDYDNVFDGTTYAPTTAALAKSQFSMKANGDADIDNSGTASAFDAGASGSGYVTFESSYPNDGTTGALDTTYESSGYTQEIVDNAGTGYLTATSLGASDNDEFVFSGWFDFDNDAGTQFLFQVNGRTEVKRVAGDIVVVIKDTSNTVIYSAQYTVAAASGLTHIHVTGKFDGTPSVTWTIDGSSISPTVNTAAATGVIDWTRSTYGILSNSAGAFVIDVEQVADLFISNEEIAASSFISGGNPIDISAVGSPLIFLGNTQTASDWNAGTNLGSGGNLTVGSATFV